MHIWRPCCWELCSRLVVRQALTGTLSQYLVLVSVCISSLHPAHEAIRLFLEPVACGPHFHHELNSLLLRSYPVPRSGSTSSCYFTVQSPLFRGEQVFGVVLSEALMLACNHLLATAERRSLISEQLDPDSAGHFPLGIHKYSDGVRCISPRSNSSRLRYGSGTVIGAHTTPFEGGRFGSSCPQRLPTSPR